MVAKDLKGEDLALVMGMEVKGKVVLGPERIGAGMIAPAVQSNNLVALGYVERDVVL